MGVHVPTITVFTNILKLLKSVDKSPIFAIFQTKGGVYSHYPLYLFYIVTHNNLLKVSSPKGLSQLTHPLGIYCNP